MLTLGIYNVDFTRSNTYEINYWKMFDIIVTMRYNNIKQSLEGSLWTLKKSYSERIIYLHGKIF